MSYPGITSDSTCHANGAGTTQLYTGACMLSALIASSANLAGSGCDVIVLHDSLDPAADPRPVLTLYLNYSHVVEFCRPYPQGLYFGIGVAAVITGAYASIHITVHAESTP